MTNEELLRRVKKEACSCDPMNGWSCDFCKHTLPKLRKVLLSKGNVFRTPPGEYPLEEFGSPYKPKKLPGIREINTPYMPKKLPIKRPRLSKINAPYYTGRR